MRKYSNSLLVLLATTLVALNHAQPLDPERNHIESHVHHLSVSDGRLLMGDLGCQILLVESMPENLTYSQDAPKHASTFFAWKLLLDQVEKQLSIASFYWSLLAEPYFNASAIDQGRDMYNLLLEKTKHVNLTIAQSGKQVKDKELDGLAARGARVHWVDFTKLFGRGVLHTKLWIADQKHGYLGSANMDWRSLTEVKELGALMINCPQLVTDIDKIHKAYTLAASGLPKEWPTELKTTYNRTNPLAIEINGIPSRIYVSSSPIELNPEGRTFDLDAILSIIADAEKFIYISVMDYCPEIVSYDRNVKGKYWPVIDDALRIAAVDRGVEVRLLISRWPYSSPSIPKYLASLRSLNRVRSTSIRIRYFVVPSFTEAQRVIPHARVNHNKYMVTDKTAYIGTSNWSGDYFIYTGGAALVIEEDQFDGALPDDSAYPGLRDPQKTLRRQLTEVFYRDWNSEYSFEE